MEPREGQNAPFSQPSSVSGVGWGGGGGEFLILCLIVQDYSIYFFTLSDPVTYLIGSLLPTGWGADIAIRSQFLIN